jgi:hypothetical protein
MRAAHRLILSGALLFTAAATARAQGAREPAAGRSEVSGGVSWIGTTSFGSADATLTGPSGDRVRLFSTSTELAGAAAFDARYGYRVTRLVQAEVSASYSTPAITTTISADAESGAGTTASESIRQLTVLGGAIVWLPRWQAGNARPFVAGGGGYLRLLHEGETLAEGGGVFYAGGGAAFPLSQRGRGRRLKEVGIRADVRALFRTGALTLDGRVHAAPEVAVSLFTRF